MSELQIVDRVCAAFRTRDNMINCGALLLPDPGMGGLKSISQHLLTTQGAKPGLRLPEAFNVRRVRQPKRLAQNGIARMMRGINQSLRNGIANAIARMDKSRLPSGGMIRRIGRATGSMI